MRGDSVGQTRTRGSVGEGGAFAQIAGRRVVNGKATRMIKDAPITQLGAISLIIDYRTERHLGACC